MRFRKWQRRRIDNTFKKKEEEEQEIDVDFLFYFYTVILHKREYEFFNATLRTVLKMLNIHSDMNKSEESKEEKDTTTMIGLGDDYE